MRETLITLCFIRYKQSILMQLKEETQKKKKNILNKFAMSNILYKLFLVENKRMRRQSKFLEKLETLREWLLATLRKFSFPNLNRYLKEKVEI